MGRLRPISVGVSVIVVALGAAPAAQASAGKATIVNRIGAQAGKSVTLIQNSDFRVTGTCEDNGGGDLRANVFLQAKHKHSTYQTYGPATGVDKFNTDFGPADGKIDFTDNDANGMLPDLEEAEYYEFYAEGKHGRVFRGHEATSVHAKGHDCNFGGAFFGFAKKGPVHTRSRFEVKAGKQATIFQNKDLKITATCTDNGGGDLTANTFVSARRPHLLLYSEGTDASDTNFGPGDGPANFIESGYEATGTVPDMQADSYDHAFYTENSKGKDLAGRVATGVHVQGADCTYSGVFTGPKSGGDVHMVNAIRVNAGKSKTLFQNRDFKVTGECVLNAPGDFTADAFLHARRPNLDYIGYSSTPYRDLDFDPADAPPEITSDNATGTLPDFVSVDQYSDFWGEGKGGKALNGRIAFGVHVRGSDCSFSGIFVG